MVSISTTVDGGFHPDDVEPRMLLVHYLRTRLGRTGTVLGCDTSNCGACTVLLNGLSVKSCRSGKCGRAWITDVTVPRTPSCATAMRRDKTPPARRRRPGNRRRPSAEATAPQASGSLDIISTVAGPLAKQFAPVAAGLALGVILGLLLGHRRRVAIMVAPMPMRAIPRGSATL